MHISKKTFLAFILLAFASGMLVGVATSFPGWTRYGILLERGRLKTLDEIDYELQRKEMSLGKQLGVDRFQKEIPQSTPSKKTIVM